MRRRPGRPDGDPRRARPPRREVAGVHRPDRRARPASGCSRPSASTPGSGSSRRRGAKRRCAATGTGTSPWSTRPSPAFFQGPEPVEWLRRLDREHDDLRAALEWCLDQPGEGQAGLQHGRRAVALLGDPRPPHRGPRLARADARRGRRRASRRCAANALTGAGSLAFMQGDFRAASTFHEASLALHREMGDRAEHRLRRQQPGQHRAPARRPRAGAGALRGVDRPRRRELGDERGRAFGSINLADVATRQGDLDAARALHERDPGHDPRARAIAGWRRSRSTRSPGPRAGRATARRPARSTSRRWRSWRRSGDRRGVARVLTHLAELALSRRRHAPGPATLFRQSLAIRQDARRHARPGRARWRTWPAPSPPTMPRRPRACTAPPSRCARRSGRWSRPRRPPRTTRTWPTSRPASGADRFEAARREGRLMTPNEALATLPL